MSGIIGVLGIILKSKNDKGGPVFYNLTRGGVLLLVLCCVVIGINVLMQYYRNRAAALASERQRNIFVQDSLKAVQNALLLTQRYQFDSLSHQVTIVGLQQQRMMDLKKIETDSLRYLVTMQKFGQQLSQQKAALTDISRILNPLFPLKVQFEFSIAIDKLPDSLRTLFETVGQKTLNGKDSVFEDDINQVETTTNGGIVINGKNTLFRQGKPGSNPFSEVNAVLLAAFPKPRVQFIQKHSIKVNLGFNYFTDPNVTYYISWSGTYKAGSIHIAITGVVDDTNSQQAMISSINDLNENDLTVMFGNRSLLIPFYLDDMTIRTGANFQNYYELYFFDSDPSEDGVSLENIEITKKEEYLNIPNHR